MGQTQEQPGDQQQSESNDINQGQFGASNAFFPPLNAVCKPQPTIAQAAELAHVTQMAGGVKPLHHTGKNYK